jgi:UDP-N-acetylglucosamine 2-epimerase (non-hydrolysing)
MKKILIVFGTRPEAIKMAPLVKEFLKYSQEFETKVCVTGQHRQMLDGVLGVFDIKPDFDMNIMIPNQDLYDITSKVLLGMRDILNITKPDVVFVHGDTTTSMAAAIAAFYQKIKIAHVESGLRTYNLLSPWPEEMNRQFTDRLCEYCFTPTEISKNNLLLEKIESEKIHVTGNTVIDALFMAVNIINSNINLKEKIHNELQERGYSLGENKKFILVTGHRRENFGDGFLNICEALKKIAFLYPDMDIVYPVHLNPNVQKPVFEILAGIKNVFLISPLEYLPFVHLIQQSHLILTDSGGVQEEAPSLEKPVLVMRETTERPEAVEAGTAKLVGTNTATIIENVSQLIENKKLYEKMVKTHNPYGDGKASERIVEVLMKD